MRLPKSPCSRLRRFGFDGAILFSDILIVPYAMGQDLKFVAGEGPRLSPPLLDSALGALEAVPDRLAPVYDTVARYARSSMAMSRCWVLRAVRGPSRLTWCRARAAATSTTRARWRIAILPHSKNCSMAIEQVTVEYLRGQIDAGAEAVQLFDSWAGTLAPREFERWVIAPNARIVAALRETHGHVPVIGFPKGAGEKLPAYCRETGVDAVGVDETVDPAWAASVLPADLPVQGNLDPLVLLAGGEALEEGVRTVRRAFADRPHVFNLGHGIGQHTPIAHVERLVELVRADPA